MEKKTKQEDNGILEVSWKSAKGSSAKEVDTEMKEEDKKEGLGESKHMVKELSEEKVKKMAKEIGMQ